MRTIKLAAIGAALSLAAIGVPATAYAGGAPSTCAPDAGAPNSNAGGTPGDQNPGGDCDISGTITINTALSLATNITSFALNSDTLNTPSGAGQIVIGSNVPTGYYVSEAGPTGNFTDSSNGQTLPDSEVSANVIGDGSLGGGPVGGAPSTECPVPPATTVWSPLPDGGSPITFVNVVDQTSGSLQCAQGFTGYTTPTGYDSFDVGGWELTGVNGTPGGTYTGNVEIALWGT